VKSRKGVVPVVLIIVLALVIAVGGVGIGLAWRTNYLDKYLPARVKELLGKEAKPSDQGEEPGEEPGEKPGEESKPEEDETKDWKTYTSPSYGYSIKYPPDWSFAPQPHADFRATAPKWGGIFEIVAGPGLGLQFPEEFFEDQIAPPIERFRQITVGGKAAMRSKTTTLVYIAVTPELVFNVEYYREGYPYSEAEASNFDLILGSFKFE